MKILQGRYLKRIETDKGKLKAIQLKTEDGKVVVEIPKAIRAIAQVEIALGDEVRIWAEPSSAKRSKKKSSKKQIVTALQIVPLAPKVEIRSVEVPKKESKKQKKITVQLCQKKNCCKKGGDALWLAFESAAQQAEGNDQMQDFKLEAVGCLGGCKNGPNIRLLPANVKHRSVKPSEIEELLKPQLDKLSSTS